jgi:hypothetical protein
MMGNLMLRTAGPALSAWTIGITVLLGPVSQLHAADFLVVEKVEQLSVYNKYQQEASSRERQLLVSCVPMRIIRPNDMLGDGFTPCMQVEIDGETFYLLKENNGSLSRGGSLGYEKVFSNATVLLDTVHAVTGRSLLFSPINSRARRISPGEFVVRVFRHQNMTFCRTLSAPPVFGWIEFSETIDGRDWVVMSHRTSSRAPISRVSEKIKNRVDEVNRVLARLFRFFNVQTNQQKPTPVWIMESSSSVITCKLEGTVNAGQFEQSTFYLASEIENIALGSEFQVTRSPATIEIRAK